MMRPWKTEKSKYLLKDRWLTVRADTCVTSHGVRVDPYYVLEARDWVHILALDSDNNILT
jgi:8-oxo-dGDP phosphatase